VKIELISDPHNFFKFTSVWLTSIGATLTGLFQLWPEAATQTWVLLPDDLKQLLPVWTPKAIAFSIIIAGILSRMIKQPKLTTTNQGESDAN